MVYRTVQQIDSDRYMPHTTNATVETRQHFFVEPLSLGALCISQKIVEGEGKGDATRA